jgi:hypothetical protein
MHDPSQVPCTSYKRVSNPIHLYKTLNNLGYII